MANPEGAEAEEFLWSLGVGEALPDWLKDLRKNERQQGMNQEQRPSGNTMPRPGIGPQRAVSSGGGPEDAAPPRRPPAPSYPSAPTPAAGTSKPAAARAPATPLAAVVAPATASVTKDRRTDPDDGRVYSLEELRVKYKGSFSDQEIEAYFNSDCALVQPQTPSAGYAAATVAPPWKEEPRASPAPAPTPVPEKARPEHPTSHKFGLSIKEWLGSLDESGFLVQYHDTIAGKLDSLEQIVDIYVKADGSLDKQFFIDASIAKLGHKRLFEKWFRDNCGSS